MGKLLNAFMPKLWPWLALLLAVGIGLQQLRVAALQVDVAQLHTAQATAGQKRAEQAQAKTEKDAAALLTHAGETQGNVYEYTQQIQKLEAGRAADAGRIAGLQHSLRATATQHAQAAGDRDACRRLGDRHQELADLAARSAGVVGRAIRLVEQRDAEVRLLKKQVMIERGVVEGLWAN